MCLGLSKWALLVESQALVYPGISLLLGSWLCPSLVPFVSFFVQLPYLVGVALLSASISLRPLALVVSLSLVVVLPLLVLGSIVVLHKLYSIVHI